ncbi:hypothetical protein TVAG_264930 [Trichomonas vaginalis G3]|uniref:Uncharacterized protein n=1 Tax=Trichomonas vaginalis (strain ATCC PRA-98 / G3) TaxID=412133 RepID=A2FVP5_TRIV3|nr:hypothetical protein TVAGG3_0347250 [Trichomonas vaginalis G3]EAX91017.1 hypothetical protein TVAG_264930 [Trichomonas vaginalis G3]KAI5531049.1 hypothetical protein TVAGG3_0347250 [Trichomonas vaginalis G3]|eukprot:XP_001303947.1 hypothetical protein [Trichomonas vaginalis G3]
MLDESIYQIETVVGDNYKIQLLIELFSCSVHPYIKWKCLGADRFLIYFKNEYKYIIRISKTLNLKLESYSIEYPKTKHLSKEIFIQLTKIVQDCLTQPSAAISKIHRILHTFYVSGQMSIFADLLVNYQKDFHYCISRIENGLEIEFNEQMHINNKFKITYSQDGIVVFSDIPYYIPRAIYNNECNYFTNFFTSHTFSNIDTTDSPGMPVVIYFSIMDRFKTELQVILSTMRDTVYYSHLCRNWIPISKAITLSSNSTAFKLTIDFDIKHSKFSSYRLYSHSEEDAKITIDEEKNQYVVDFEAFVTKFCFDRNISDSRQFHVQIFPLLFQQFFNLIISPSLSITSEANRNYIFGCVLSFAPHFQVLFGVDRLKPTIKVVDLEGNEYICPELIKLRSLIKELDIKQSMHQMEIYISTFIFILEVEYLLKENKYRTERFANGLIFSYSHLSSAKINTVGNQWRLTIIFDNSACLPLKERAFQFSGEIHTARSAELVIELLHKFTSYMNLSGHMIFGSATVDSVLRDTFNFNQEGSFLTNCKIDGMGETAFFCVSFSSNSVFEGLTSKYQTIRLGHSVPSVDTRFIKNFTSNNSLSYADITSSADTKFIAYLIHSSIAMVTLEGIGRRPGWKLLSWSSPTVFQLVYNSKFTLNIELKPMHNLYLCVSSKVPSAVVIVPLASLQVNNATNVKSAYRIRYTVAELVKMIPEVEKFVKRYEEAMSVGFNNGHLVMNTVPQIIMNVPGINCIIEKERTVLQSEDQMLNNELQAIPASMDVMRLVVSLLQRPGLLLFAVRILKQMFEIDKDAAETTAATTFIENRNVIMNINGFPFELTEGKAICGDLFFMNTQKEIELALVQIVK